MGMIKYIGFTFSSCIKSSSHLGSDVNVANVSVSDPTSLTSIQTNFFKFIFHNSRCCKVFIFSVRTLPFTIFRAFLRSLKKILFRYGKVFDFKARTFFKFITITCKKKVCRTFSVIQVYPCNPVKK